uniref:Uncharacterized protein n=1 Tax=Tanacetum cinerariifolium TaxID=118510 RepID=A0A699KL91_TANCI|nr:hypothetical protein [Tanacetum cinerariifolium]
MRIKSSESVYTARKPLTFSRLATVDPPRDIGAQTTPPRRSLTPNSIDPLSTVMPTTWLNLVTLVNVRERFHNEMKCHKYPSKFARFLTFGASTSRGRSHLYEGTNMLFPIYGYTTLNNKVIVTLSNLKCKLLQQGHLSDLEVGTLLH